MCLKRGPVGGGHVELVTRWILPSPRRDWEPNGLYERMRLVVAVVAIEVLGIAALTVVNAVWLAFISDAVMMTTTVLAMMLMMTSPPPIWIHCIDWRRRKYFQVLN